MKPVAPLQDSPTQLTSNITALWKRLTRQLRINIHDLVERMRISSLKSRVTVGLFIIFILIGSCGVIASVVGREDKQGSASQMLCSTTYSTWMAESIVARQQGLATGSITASVPLQAGIIQKAFTAVVDRYPENQLVSDYIYTSASSIAPYFVDPARDIKNWPLDRLSNGNAMIQNGDSAFNKPLWGLAQSIAYNQRNSEEGLWYWDSYPQWSYLDGMYSFGPFSALYILHTSCSDEGEDDQTCTFKNETMDDIVSQFTLLREHCRNTTTGLLYHGYDESRRATWAALATGSSPIVWGRSLGWYTMGLVDTIELLPAISAAPWRGPLLGYYRDLARSIMDFVDDDTGGWYQVVDQGGREGNYIESSATAMFSYALLKGARLGYVAEEDVGNAQRIGRQAHRYLTEAFVDKTANGTLGWNGTVGVCSLNSTATYEYYVGQPIDYNSPHGAGAYILASVEVEILENTTWHGNGTNCTTP